MTRIPLAGLGFDSMDAPAAAAWIAARPANTPFGYVVTPNADHLVRLNRDPELRAVYRRAALCMLDSRVVAGIAWLLRLGVPTVSPGSDITACLLNHHVAADDRITIVGLSPARLAALIARYGLSAVAHYDPPMGFDRDPAALAAAVAFVLANPARFVFLAIGSPRQERLAAAIVATGAATGMGLCIGASLEFLTGARRRAPAIVRQAGMEWLFRLIGEPRRLWRRYLVESPKVIALLVRRKIG